MIENLEGAAWGPYQKQFSADVNAVPGVAQTRPSGAEMFGLSRGPSVGLFTIGSPAPTDIEFQTRLVPPSSFVITWLARGKSQG